MIRITLNSLWAHKRRLIATCVAVVLGVAFMAGTLVLTTTINSIFDDLFAAGTEGTDAIVRGPVLFKDDQAGTRRDLIDEDTVESVRAVDGVDVAEAVIATEELSLLDKAGEPMGGQGPPTFVGSWIADEGLNPYQVVEGRAPRADGEAVLDKAVAQDGPFEVGEELTLVTPKGKERLTLVGLTRFGDADSAGGVIRVSTTLAGAQALSNEPGKLDEVYVRAETGVSPTALVERIEEAGVTPEADVVTGEQAATELANELKGIFGFFSNILLVFAFIALFVGVFIISNTFSILVAQRTRELALLRALGASRRQILASVLLEAGAIGVASALIGFLVGVALAAGALSGLRALGLDLPSAGITVEASTAVFAIVVGLTITAVAALLPAIRATRVAPVAALRDVANDQSGRSKLRTGIGIAFLLLGALLIVPAFGSDPTTDDLPGIGGGLALLVIGVLVLGPIFARPLSAVVGSPLPSLRGVTGKLSRQNAMRNPRRTASTASALIIGVTLIVFITVFAASAQTSISNSIGGGFNGDYIVQPASQASFAGVSPDLAASLAEVDGVDVVAAASFAPAQMELPNGAKPGGFVSGIDPGTYQQVFNVKMDQGSLGDLRPGTIVVDRQIVKKQDLAIGDEIKIVSASGRTGAFELVAVSDEPNLLGNWTLSADDGRGLNPAPTDSFVGVQLDATTTVGEIRPELKKIVADYPTMKLQDRDQFTGSIVDQIKALLNVIYGLLAVSVLIALIGIANTLSLSIFERTRELGLLRATGMTRSQLRSSVRWEAAIVALMGTAIGLALGLGLSWVLVKALVSQGFTRYQVPVLGYLSLTTIVVIAVVLGVVAALWPAFKASKLNVLDAIGTE